MLRYRELLAERQQVLLVVLLVVLGLNRGQLVHVVHWRSHQRLRLVGVGPDRQDTLRLVLLPR